MSEPAIANEVQMDRRFGQQVFWLILSVGLLLNGARLASSDEIAVYLLTESLIEHGDLDVPAGITPNGSWFDGHFYVWYEIGTSLLIIPWYLLGRIVALLIPLGEGYDVLVLRALVSTMGAWMGAWLALIMFRCARLLGSSWRLSIFLAMGLVCTTFLLPYLKTILRDVPMALMLLAAFYHLLRIRSGMGRSRDLLLAGFFCGMGFLIKITFLMYLPMLWGYLYFALRRRDVKSSAFFLGPIILALAIAAWYNFARFGDPLDLGYHGGTSFPTPLHTGIFGLLWSPGKGLFWFAPLTILIGWAGRDLFRKHRAEAVLFACIVISTLVLHAKYFAWGGDGSWGPRYLLVLLPMLILSLAPWLQRASVGIRRTAVALACVGFGVQLAGTAIYQGNYLRKIGEFPFTRPFTDPEFMYRSHFIPQYSPIIGHWKMAAENLGNHIRGNWPNLKPGPEVSYQRVPLAEEAKPALLATFDFWFMYAVYAGFPTGLIATVLGILVAAVGLQSIVLGRSLRLGGP